MADKAISELLAANQVTPSDLFVLEQSGTAKKLTGRTLEKWLISMADGHGGIRSIEKQGTSGLKDTYRITFADTTTFDFVVTNGKAINSVNQTSVLGLTRTYTIAFNDGTSQTFNVMDGRSITDIAKTGTDGLADTYTISYNDGTSSTFTVKNGKGIQSFAKVSTDGLVDTYRIEYNDGTFDEFTVTNGAKGDQGDNTYTHIKFASQEPTEASHFIGDVPDKWIGFYWGSSSTAPTDWTQYKWYQFKGDKGDTGSPATLRSATVEYQVGNSGTIIPSEAWTVSVPVVPQGKFLWTRTTQRFNTGSPVVSYSVTRMGMDGAGSVVSVNYVSPDSDGNVFLTPEDVSARPNTWMPTAQQVGARPDTWLPTATEIGAAPADLDVHFCDGEVLAVQNSGDAPLHSLKIYGKTVQNGTPTPENPVPLESVGDGGSVGVSVAGKNLLELTQGTITLKGVTCVRNADGSVILNGKAESDSYFLLNTCDLGEGEYILSGCPTGGSTRTYRLYDDVSRLADLGNGTRLNGGYTAKIYIFIGEGYTASNLTFYPMIRNASITDATFEPGKPIQTLTASTPNGLPGIPVESGGNYTDENGQQWICDEIDFERGLYVQRIEIFRIADIVNSDFGITSLGVPWFDAYFSTTIMTGVNALSTSYKKISNSVNGEKGTFKSFSSGFTIYDSAFTDAKQAKQRLIDMGAVFLAVLGTPVETPIPEEELAAYRALHTNYPNTAVYNNVGAYMDMEYYSPNSALPVNLGSGMAGELLTVNEHGCVTSLPNPMVESLEHRGCYYRMSNGEMEWINPPMISGTMYRTAKRHNGKPVFTQLTNIGTLPNASTTFIPLGVGCTSWDMIGYRYHLKSNDHYNRSFTKDTCDIYCADIGNVYNAVTETTSDYSGYTCEIVAEYVAR